MWTSSVIAAFQIIGFLCDFDRVFPDDWNFIKRLFVSAAIVIALWCIMFGLVSIYINKKRIVVIFDADNGHHVYVEYGDLFANDRNEKIIIVTANRCFDTLVDNDLISDRTIHGLAIQKICTNGFSAKSLNKALQDDLIRRFCKPEKNLTSSEKRKGNLVRYPVGTIAEFKKREDDKKTYAFVGMAAFNSDLHPVTTDEEYVLTLQRLIEYCNARSQRVPVYMPVIGTNGRNHKKSERELLEYMVSVLRLNRHLINTDIHIVVYDKRRADVSIQNV